MSLEEEIRKAEARLVVLEADVRVQTALLDVQQLAVGVAVEKAEAQRALVDALRTAAAPRLAPMRSTVERLREERSA